MTTEQSSAEPRFLADVMLGTLAKWLRVLGYDTVYDNRIEDEEIVVRCVCESRIALTRDRRLVRRRLLHRSLLIRSTELSAQLRQVLDFIGRTPDYSLLLSRCLECNTRLVAVPRESIQTVVPPFVFRTQSDFKLCPSCRRVYWGGTHRKHIQKRLEILLSLH